MRNTKPWLMATVAAVVVLLAAVPGAWAKKLDEAQVFIEINDTDGDAGFQIFFDGEGWRRMKLFDPDGNKILDVRAQGSVRRQGVTEGFFESAEPSFDEQPLEDFLALFPEGRYRFEGITADGEPLTGKDRLTHSLPGAPILVSPEDGDEVDPDDTVIEWQAVADPPGSSIVGYQVIVETEEPRLLVFAADVEPETTSITVPPEFMRPGQEYKYEVIALEESGNKTISEAEFETE